MMMVMIVTVMIVMRGIMAGFRMRSEMERGQS
jgi:hypothetical protein